MPGFTTSDFPRPKDEEEFQEIIRDLYAAHWKDDNVQIYGRSGQAQHGIDVYGHPNKSNLCFGIQCKVRNLGELTKAMIEVEIKKARGFKEKLSTYIFATTAPRDIHIQATIDELSAIEQKSGGFEIQIKFWEDICSLLAEHHRLIDKHFKDWAYPRKVAREPLAEHPSEITETSPLLIGVILDASASMLSTIAQLANDHSQSYIDLPTALSIVVERTKSYCKTPEGTEYLPLFSLFVYGFGFGKLRKTTTSVVNRILGIRSNQGKTELIPDQPIRDMFAENAAARSLPYTPNLVDLNRNWKSYQQSLEWQFTDGGLGPSSLYDALMVAHDRIFHELENPFFEHPILLVISNGQIDNASDQDLYRACHDLQKLGTHIACLYLGQNVIAQPRKLYSSPEHIWPEEAKRLFNCASVVSEPNQVMNEIITIAKEKQWDISDDSKLFIQLNQEDMVNEFVDIVMSQLRKDRLKQE